MHARTLMDFKGIMLSGKEVTRYVIPLLQHSVDDNMIENRLEAARGQDGGEKGGWYDYKGLAQGDFRADGIVEDLDCGSCYADLYK